MSFFIAEVSSNHSKNIERSIEFIDKASEIDCDAVKFQLFKIDKLFALKFLKNLKFIEKEKNGNYQLNFFQFYLKDVRGIKYSLAVHHFI